MAMIHQQSSQNAIMEVREDYITSPVGDRQPTFRAAHFLKPIANSTHELLLNQINLNPFPSSSSCSVFQPKEGPFEIYFNGWRCQPIVKWVRWVDKLKPKYESVWKKAGIFEAILSTKSHIMKNQDLVYGVVEKWCSETNTFVFLFGEATITLEDVMILGGYPILGDPVFISLEDQEMREVEKKLILAKEHLTPPTTSLWMAMFIDKGSEIELEAFLVTWLSFFVFPHKYHAVQSFLFPIAIHLARGNTIALAPAVLACLYKDLSLFKETIVGLKKCSVRSDKLPLVLQVNVQSPFYLVQVWVWERFRNLQPQPKLINNRDPLLLRWDMVTALKIDNVRLALDSARHDFIWRPYVRYVDKCRMFYPNDEILVPFKNDLDKEMMSFVTCLRVSELVGFASIEKYLPHRVAMQFGMDQNVPGYVPRLNKTKTIAWKNYCRPISDKSLYFPSRLFEAGITTFYANWWKKSVLGPQGFVKNDVSHKRIASSLKCRPHAEIPHDDFEKYCNDGSKTSKGDTIVDDVPFGFMISDIAVEDCLNSSLPPNHNTLTPSISVDDCKHVLEDDANESKIARLSSDRICHSETQTESYSYLSEASVAALEQSISRLERVRAKLKNDRLGLS
ncbi:serine/threonine-protein phosphatase 7 long form protein [Trifolium repens]|nr:serine/threonine-protein phosphatase 7 long form protein [Trifolium repens]KAK2387312.1 serine/threonine-protein phosphatase 7 long form protein [Trifolium repens]